MGAFDGVASPVTDAPAGSPFAGVASVVANDDMPKPIDAPKTIEQTLAPENLVPAAVGAVSGLAAKGAELMFPGLADIKKARNYVIDKAADLPSIGGGTIGEKIPGELDKISGAMEVFKQKHPYAGIIMDSAGDTAKIAAVLPTGAAVENAAATAAKTIANQAEKKAALSLTSEQVKERFTDPAFLAARQSGASLSPTATDEALLAVQKQLKRDPKIAADAADKMVDDMINGGSNTTKWAGDSTDLETMMAKHAELNSLINKAYVSGDNNLARKYTIIRDGLKDTLDNAAAEHLTNPAGVDQFKMANHHFGQQADLNTIEGVVNSTQNMAQPANSLASRFDKLLNKKNKSFLKTDQERELAQKIASTTKAQDLMKVGAGRLVDYTAAGVGAAAGSILGPGGSVGGGVAGAMAGHALSAKMRDALWSSKMKQIDELKAMILSREAPEAISDAMRNARKK